MMGRMHTLLFVTVFAVSAVISLTSDYSKADDLPEAPTAQTLNRQGEVSENLDVFEGFSSKAKSGFTIWGIQPGDNIQEVLSELPQDAKVEIVTEGRSWTLHGSQDRRLEILAIDGIIEELKVWPVQYSFTLEDSGDILIGGKASTGQILRTFGSEVTDRGGLLVVSRDNLQLSMTYLTDYGIHGAVLKRASSRAQSE